MAQAAIKVGQAFIPVEVDFTGVNKKVAKSVARTMNYAGKSARFPVRHTMFAGAAPAFTKAMTKTNFAADAMFKGKFQNRMNRGLSRSLATAISRTKVSANTNWAGGLANSFHKGFSARKISPSSLFQGGIPGFQQFGRAAYTALAAGLTVGSALTARTAIKSFGEYERAQIGLTSMLKSAERANALLKEIQDFAVVSPFNMQNLVDSTKQLVAFGFAAEDIIPIMRDIGDTAAALGTGDEGIQRMIRAMGQIRVKGRVMAEELLQLTEIGVNAPGFIADALGVSTREALDLVHHGKVDAETGIAALREGMRKAYAGMMKEQESSLFGLWANFKDQFEIAARVLFTPFSVDVKKWLADGIDALERVRRWGETEWPKIVDGFRKDPSGTIKRVGKQMYDSFANQDWAGLWAKIKAGSATVFDVVKSIDWSGVWGGFTKKAGEAYLFVKGQDWAGIWKGFESGFVSVYQKLRDYDWASLGNTIKRELLDAWETGKSIAAYLKERFDSVDWSSVATNAVNTIGNVQRTLRETVLSKLDDFGEWADRISKGTDWKQLGQDLGTDFGTALSTWIRNIVDGTVDIGQWVVDKVKAFDWQTHLGNAIDFGSAFSDAFIRSFAKIDLQQLTRQVNETLQAWKDDPSLEASLEAQIKVQEGSAAGVAFATDFVQAFQSFMDEQKVTFALNAEASYDDAKKKGEEAGSIFGNSAAVAAMSLGPVADALFEVDGNEIGRHVETYLDVMDSGVTNIKASLWSFLSSSVEGIKTFVGSVLYFLAGAAYATIQVAMGALVGWIMNKLKGIADEVNVSIDVLNRLTGWELPRIDLGERPANIEKYNRERVDFWTNQYNNLLGSGGFGSTGTRLWIEQNSPATGASPSDPVADTIAGRGKSIQVNQYFDGHYIEPRNAQHAAMLGIRAGV